MSVGGREEEVPDFTFSAERRELGSAVDELGLAHWVGPRVWLGAQSLHSGILKVQLLWRLLIPFAPFSVFCFELGFNHWFLFRAGRASCMQSYQGS